MTRTLELVYAGEVFRPQSPVDMEPDTHFLATLEEMPPQIGEPHSFLRYAMSLKLEGPSKR